MRVQRVLPIAVLSVLALVIASPAWSQSITTDANIETEGQLVSTVARGTAPLVVASATPVDNLNADYLDGSHASAFAQDTDLQSVETMLTALQLQVDALGLALVPRTGQTAEFAAGDDGALRLGVTWPNPRFTKNGDGTVTDNLTGLIWLENADCAAATMNWDAAWAFANTLSDGSLAHNNGDCGLSDYSAVGAWRLPNVRELQSLVHYGFTDPAVPNTAGTGQWSLGDPFSFVQQELYWSSTTFAAPINAAWSVNMEYGNVPFVDKLSSKHVWPVRGGQ